MTLPVAPSLHPETLPLDGTLQTTFELVIVLVVAFALGTLAVLLVRALMERLRMGFPSRGERSRSFTGTKARRPVRPFPVWPSLRPRRGPAV